MAIECSITRLPRDPGESGWNAVLTPAPAANPLQDDIRADWLVIGAGFAGLAAARELSLLCPGDRISVLDAVRVAEGPAGRNSGFMIDLPHDISPDGYANSLENDIRQAALNRIAIGFAGQAAEEYGLSRECFDRSGKLSAAATAGGLRHNEDYAHHLSEMGEPHRLMNAAEIRDLTGTDYYQGALFTPGAAMIQPAMFMRAMAAGLAGKVSVFENSPVVGLANTGGQWIATTPAGSVTAPKAILAVNGHAESFGFYRRRLMHIFTYASMTRALTEDEVSRLGGAARWAATPADPMGTTVRRISGIGGERIIIRNRFTYDPTMEVGAARLVAVKRDHRQPTGRASRRSPMSNSTIHGAAGCAWPGTACRPSAKSRRGCFPPAARTVSARRKEPFPDSWRPDWQPAPATPCWPPCWRMTNRGVCRPNLSPGSAPTPLSAGRNTGPAASSDKPGPRRSRFNPDEKSPHGRPAAASRR